MRSTRNKRLQFGRTALDPAEMGTVLRMRRESLGMSQRDLADRAAVAPTTIHNMEQGSVRVQLDKFLQVLGALDLVPTQVMEIEAVVVPVVPTPLETEIIQLVRKKDPVRLMQRIAELLKRQSA